MAFNLVHTIYKEGQEDEKRELCFVCAVKAAMKPDNIDAIIKLEAGEYYGLVCRDCGAFIENYIEI